ncbi:MAG: SPW repeat protein [Candidatus Aquicultorales bacterium]
MEWSWANLILGIWTAASPWILRFASFRTILWNNVLIGALVILLSLVAIGTAQRNIGWIMAAAGAWLAISPFILIPYRLSSNAVWNNVIVGLLLIIFSLLGIFWGRTSRVRNP